MVSGALLGLVLLTKNEGQLMAIACIAPLALASPRSPSIRARLGPMLLAAAPFCLLLLAFAHVTPRNDLVAGSSLDFVSWERARMVTGAFWRVVRSATLFKGLFLVGGLAGLVGLRAGLRALRRGEEGAAGEHTLWFLTLAAAGAGFFVVYLLTPHDLRWHLSTSCNRVFLQLYPPLVVFVLSIGADAPR